MTPLKRFTRVYPLQKTLRFELKPIGKTLENVISSGLLEQDQHRADSYIKVKGIIDEYHKAFIETVLNDFKLNYTDEGKKNSLEEFYTCYMCKSKDDVQKKLFEEIQGKLRKQIADCFSKDDKFKRIDKKELIKEDFDYVLVDCPAGIEQGFQNAVAGANEAIVVTTPEMSAIRDADRIIGLLESKEGVEKYRLLVNRVRPKLEKENAIMGVDDVVEILSCDLIGFVPEDTNIITSTNKGEPVVNDEKSYNLEGVMSHFADDDKHHEAYYLFEDYVKKIKKKNIMIHCFASSSLNSYFENISTHIRVGLKLFGIGERNSFLHNVVRLTCLPLSIKKIGKDERVGYDFSYMTKESGYLYILPFGYGKGFPRLNNLVAFCDNSYLRQAGKMSMDFSTFYFRKLLKTNDEIEIFGKKIPIESICKNNDVSAHELLVNLKVNKKYYETKI